MDAVSTEAARGHLFCLGCDGGGFHSRSMTSCAVCEDDAVEVGRGGTGLVGGGCIARISPTDVSPMLDELLSSDAGILGAGDVCEGIGCASASKCPGAPVIPASGGLEL